MQGERAGEPVGPDVWQTCRELIPAGSVFAFLAEHREVLFPAGMFAGMYPSPNGRASLPPQGLAAGGGPRGLGVGWRGVGGGGGRGGWGRWWWAALVCGWRRGAGGRRGGGVGGRGWLGRGGGGGRPRAGWPERRGGRWMPPS